MKSFILVLILLSSASLFAQADFPALPMDTITNKIKFQEVVQETGTKDELFNRCIYWLNGFYKDPTRVTTIRDIVTGKVEGRHQFRIYTYDEDSAKRTAGMVKYTFVIELKDGKYRYTITELLLRSATNMPLEKWLDTEDESYDERWLGYLQQVANYADNWSKSLKSKMKPEKEKVEDDW